MGAARTDSHDWFSTDVPTSARVWNFWQGGSDHGDVDRQAGERSMLVFPGVADLARSSRAFITRSVRFLAGGAGVEQVLDVGPGLPTEHPTHEIVERSNPNARAVYIAGLVPCHRWRPDGPDPAPEHASLCAVGRKP